MPDRLVKLAALIGFACYDCPRKNFSGPTGVVENARGRSVGLELLLSCLYAMRENGYAHAIISGVGPAEYYSKTVGAMVIEGASPGIYDFRLLRNSQPEQDNHTVANPRKIR
jgi:hypothetical protein